MDYDSISRIRCTSRKEYFDPEAPKWYAGDDEEMIMLTRAELRGSLLVLQNQAKHHDLAGLHSTGHKLYGTAASEGLVALSGLARRLKRLRDKEQALLETLITQTKAEVTLLLDLLP